MTYYTLPARFAAVQSRAMAESVEITSHILFCADDLSEDPVAARLSAQRPRALELDHLLPGHDPALVGRASDRVRLFLWEQT